MIWGLHFGSIKGRVPKGRMKVANQRWYFPNGTGASVSPTALSSWESTSPFKRSHSGAWSKERASKFDTSPSRCRVCLPPDLSRDHVYHVNVFGHDSQCFRRAIHESICWFLGFMKTFRGLGSVGGGMCGSPQVRFEASLSKHSCRSIDNMLLTAPSGIFAALPAVHNNPATSPFSKMPI